MLTGMTDRTRSRCRRLATPTDGAPTPQSPFYTAFGVAQPDPYGTDEDVGVAIPAAMAFLGLVFVCCVLLVTGLPPLPGFLAKFALLSTAHRRRAGRRSRGADVDVRVPPCSLAGFASVIALRRIGMRLFWSVSRAHDAAACASPKRRRSRCSSRCASGLAWRRARHALPGACRALAARAAHLHPRGAVAATRRDGGDTSHETNRARAASSAARAARRCIALWLLLNQTLALGAHRARRRARRGARVGGSTLRPLQPQLRRAGSRTRACCCRRAARHRALELRGRAHRARLGARPRGPLGVLRQSRSTCAIRTGSRRSPHRHLDARHRVGRARADGEHAHAARARPAGRGRVDRL